MSGARYVDLDDVLSSIRQAVNVAQTEEDLRLRVSGVIEQKVLKPLGITQVGKYEYTLVSGVKVDALYGHVLIEYKAPGKLSSKADVSKAKEQLVNYSKSRPALQDSAC
ncbi:MAG: hypothetical protein QW217_05915 [Candidatus Caldarchaeum sp.]